MSFLTTKNRSKTTPKASFPSKIPIKRTAGRDDIIYSRDGMCSAWRLSRKYWRLQTANQEISRRMQRWEHIWLTAYGVNCFLWVFMVPMKHLRLTLKTLDFPLPRKNPKRVAAGKRRGRLNVEMGIVGAKNNTLSMVKGPNKARPGASKSAPKGKGEEISPAVLPVAAAP